MGKKFGKFTFMKLRHFPKWSTKIMVIFLIGLLGVGGVLGFEYYTVNRLLQEGEALVASQKYGDAITKFTQAKSHWSLDSVKKTLEAQLQTALKLEKSIKSFERGQLLFDQGKWEEAIKALDEVVDIDPNYQEAQLLFSEARNKLAFKTLAESKLVLERRNVNQDKLKDIENIDKQIELLLSQQQNRYEISRGHFDAFWKCEQQGNIRCMEFTLKQIDELKAESDRLQTRIDNLSLQRATLQSGL